MKLERAFAQIRRDRPQLVHLSGKTSTGKSTFAGRMHDELDYVVIELDRVVVGDIMPQFGLTERGTTFVHIYKLREERPELVTAFVKATQAAINKALAAGHSVVVDGAVSHPDTLADLFNDYDDFIFLYLHPETLETYINNLTSRFMLSTVQNSAGLPIGLWGLVDKDAFAVFCKTRQLTPELTRAIRTYALRSQQESLKRLDTLRARFPHLTLVTI